ncbi:MAG TPA: lipopolysaccharide heptosyltransferase II [Firmicutes bacterium]|nr:lipopolysaccharide heptosyltransferase II [Bacillota bacterium]
MPATQPNRIVVIDWSMIGDLVMLSPAIRALRAEYPQAHLAVLGQPSSICVFKHDPSVDELIPYDRSKGDYDLASFFASVRALRRERFDLGFIFHNSLGSALMAWLGGVRRRVGYRHEMRDILLHHKYKLPRERIHLVEVKARLLEQFGIEVTDLHEEVHAKKEGAKKWLVEKLGPNFGRTRPVVGISLGATKPYKRWSATSLNNFINQFPVNSCDFIFLGAPGERELYEGVYSYNNSVVDLTGQTTIDELMWVLDRVDLFVGPDSGPMHLAAGLNTPLVGLFGPTDPARCGPYEYARAEIIRSHRICQDCETRHGKHVRQCLHTIDHNEVFAGASQLLDRFHKGWNSRG